MKYKIISIRHGICNFFKSFLIEQLLHQRNNEFSSSGRLIFHIVQDYFLKYADSNSVMTLQIVTYYTHAVKFNLSILDQISVKLLYYILTIFSPKARNVRP